MSGALEIASELLGKVGKPAYIEFSTQAKQLHTKSEQEGRYVAVDVDMVTVRQIGSADSSIFEVDRWLAQNTREVQGGRLPREHADYYMRAYKAWKAGQEVPLEGTPIKGWAVIAPSQAEAIIRAGIRTVEDVATMNAEAMQRIGMGAVMLKHKAAAWVAQAQDKGPLTIQMANLQVENERLKATLDTLTEHVKALQAERPGTPTGTMAEPEEPPSGIGLSEILDEEPPKRSHKKKEA
jgi:hypothetical protein